MRFRLRQPRCRSEARSPRSLPSACCPADTYRSRSARSHTCCLRLPTHRVRRSFRGPYMNRPLYSASLPPTFPFPAYHAAGWRPLYSPAHYS